MRSELPILGQTTRRWARAVLLFAALASCAFGPRASFRELEAMVAQLEIPPGWELVSEEVVRGHCIDPVESCPRIDRHYEVETTPEFVEDVLEMFAAVGLDTEPHCDEPIEGCGIWANKGNINVDATVIEVEGSTLTVSLLVR